MEQLIIFLPFIGALLSGFFGKYLGDRVSEILTSLFVSIAAILSIIIFYNVIFFDYINNITIFIVIIFIFMKISEIFQLYIFKKTQIKLYPHRH